MQRVEQRPQFALGRLRQPVGEGRQPVEQRGDVAQRGRCRCRLSCQRHEALSPLGDGGLQLVDALGDPATQRRRHVVGFQVDQLAIETAFEVGDLLFDLSGAFGNGRGTFRFGRGIETRPPVVRALGSEECRGEEQQERVVEA
ncbi:MAG: hypothetical protein ACRDY2_01550 [Acidimicrobiales bacterium]